MKVEINSQITDKDLKLDPTQIQIVQEFPDNEYRLTTLHQINFSVIKNGLIKYIFTRKCMPTKVLQLPRGYAGVFRNYDRTFDITIATDTEAFKSMLESHLKSLLSIAVSKYCLIDPYSSEYSIRSGVTMRAMLKLQFIGSALNVIIFEKTGGKTLTKATVSELLTGIKHQINIIDLSNVQETASFTTSQKLTIEPKIIFKNAITGITVFHQDDALKTHGAKQNTKWGFES